MILKKKIFTLLFAVLCLNVFAQKKENLDLKNTIQKIILGKKADVGISIIGTENDIVSIN